MHYCVYAEIQFSIKKMWPPCDDKIAFSFGGKQCGGNSHYSYQGIITVCSDPGLPATRHSPTAP